MVHFVGAGPGATDLITLRGAELLRRADLVIYAGSLVNPELLRYCREDVEIHNSAFLDLEQILALMEAAEKAGKTTVRLHTGDPSLYGAIREQIDALAERGISCDVVPGVSSFCAAAAVIGKEFTVPEISQSLILTRLEGRTPVPATERLETLAAHGSSLVLFLSSGMLDRVREELLKGAYSEDTPAALIYKASWPEEKIVRCTVGTLPEAGAENGIHKTALVLVGDFLGKSAEQSKLYDPAFSTEYRTAGKDKN